MKESVCFSSLQMRKGAPPLKKMARNHSDDTDQTQERGGGMCREQMSDERSPATPSPAPDSLKAQDNFLISKWMNGMNSGEGRREEMI